MPRYKKPKTVAKKFPLLYVFAAVTILLNIIGIIIGFSNNEKQAYQVLQISPQAVHQIMVVSLIWSIIYNGAVAGYLLFSKNFRGVYLLLKILLVWNLLGILFIPFLLFGHGYGYSVLFKIFTTISFVVQMWLIVALVRQLSKAKVRELKYAPVHPKSKLFRTVPKNYVPPKPILLPNTFTTVLKVILRITSGSWALVIIYIGVLVSFGPNSHPINLGIPLILMGVLYLIPYYILNRNLTVAYTLILITFTALVIFLLHLPVKHGLPAFASLPAPAFNLNHTVGQTFDVTAMYAFAIFHSTGFLITVSLFLSMDAILGVIKYAVIPDNVKQSIKVLTISVVILSLLVLAGVAQSNAAHQPQRELYKSNQCDFWKLHIGEVALTYCSPKSGQLPFKIIELSNSTPQQLSNFTSTKYKFTINFPCSPSAEDNMTNTNDEYNYPVPYTYYSCYPSGGNQLYEIYAYKWPNNDSGFDQMTDEDLRTTLKNFVTTDVQNNNGTLINTKYVKLFSGKTLAADAHFIYLEDSNANGYLREFTIGDYEYYIETQSVPQSDFQKFANSFKFSGTIAPQDTNTGTGSNTSNAQSGLRGQPLTHLHIQ